MKLNTTMQKAILQGLDFIAAQQLPAGELIATQQLLGSKFIDTQQTSGGGFIAGQQLVGGGFISLSSPVINNFHEAHVRQTTFFPSLILSALGSIPSVKLADNPSARLGNIPSARLNDNPSARLGNIPPVKLEDIKNKISNFLLMNKSETWSLNYWDRQSLEAKKLAYPDDLDDTFCALSALCQLQPELFNGEALAAVAHLLIDTESAEGGPYSTWLVDSSADEKWQYVDIAVNANVGYFLSLQNITLPNLVSFVETSLEKPLYSPYYPSPYPIHYFISRWYKGEKRSLAVSYLLAEQRNGTWGNALDGTWGNALDTALAVSTLLRYEYPRQQLSAAVEHLLKNQNPDGSWPAAAFCIDPDVDGKTHYGGAASLTTALCLEALQLYEQASDDSKIEVAHRPKSDVYADHKPKTDVYVAQKPKSDVYVDVVSDAKRVITKMPNRELRKQTRKVLTQIVDKDENGQVVMLPWLIAKACGQKPDEKLLKQLASASLWGWMAYTTYDDFLDGEGQPILLPSANAALRNLTHLQKETLPQNQAFQAEVRQIMDRLDAANAWEISYCRGQLRDGRLHLKKLPNYGDLWQLADRSLGHTIAGLGVLYGLGMAGDSATMRGLREFFKHYLIARQLNDDAHDWEQDLKLGHVNSVAVFILTKWLKHHSFHGGIDLSRHTEKFRQIMWEDAIITTCRLITHHVACARQAILSETVQLQLTVLEPLLKPLEQSAQLALQKRSEALDFIAAL